MRLQNIINNVATTLADDIIRSGHDFAYSNDGVPVTVAIITTMGGDIDCIHAQVGHELGLTHGSYRGKTATTYSDLIACGRETIVHVARAQIEAALIICGHRQDLLAA